MDEYLKFNLIYSQLTKTESADTATLNFFESLGHRKSGFKVVSVLLNLEGFEIVRGFISEKIEGSESVSAQTFKSCIIMPEPGAQDGILSAIRGNKQVKSAEVLSSGAIAFLIK
jgi:hypothetical protein